MKYVFDHDMHIHSGLSLCSGDAAQNPQTILKYAVDNRLKTVILTDHYWDETVPGAENFEFYAKQPTERVRRSLPLPQADGVRFLFGCETDLKADLTLGISKERFNEFDFVIIPTTHLHMNGFTCRGDEDVSERAQLYCSRLDGVLDMDLPFHKIGIAHLTCELMSRNHTPEVLNSISDETLIRLFDKAKDRGVGIELNFNAKAITPENADTFLRPYRIAKEEGCKFYFGSDAHHPAGLAAEPANAAAIIDMLALEESDKWVLA